jgi:hypothetical protein
MKPIQAHVCNVLCGVYPICSSCLDVKTLPYTSLSIPQNSKETNIEGIIATVPCSLLQTNHFFP